MKLNSAICAICRGKCEWRVCSAFEDNLKKYIVIFPITDDPLERQCCSIYVKTSDAKKIELAEWLFDASQFLFIIPFEDVEKLFSIADIDASQIRSCPYLAEHIVYDENGIGD